jgi:hypothetical protein
LEKKKYETDKQRKETKKARAEDMKEIGSR